MRMPNHWNQSPRGTLLTYSPEHQEEEKWAKSTWLAVCWAGGATSPASHLMGIKQKGWALPWAPAPSSASSPAEITTEMVITIQQKPQNHRMVGLASNPPHPCHGNAVLPGSEHRSKNHAAFLQRKSCHSKLIHLHRNISEQLSKGNKR